MKKIITIDQMEQKNNLMKRSIVVVTLLLMISVATPAQVAIELKIEKQQIDNKQNVKVMLKNISDYNLSIWTDCDWEGAYGGFFSSDPSSYFIIIGNPNMSDSISTQKIIFPGTLSDTGRCIKRRVLVMSGETYTGLFPIWGGNYTRKDGFPLDRKNNIKEIQVKVMARYYDIHASKVVHVEVLSNVLKL